MVRDRYLLRWSGVVVAAMVGCGGWMDGLG